MDKLVIIGCYIGFFIGTILCSIFGLITFEQTITAVIFGFSGFWGGVWIATDTIISTDGHSTERPTKEVK